MNITKETWICEADCWLVFGTLLPACHTVTIIPVQQHVIFAQELQSALPLTVGFWNILEHFGTFIANCNKLIISVTRIFHLNIKLIIKLRVNNLSFCIAAHDTFCMCKFKHVYRGNHSELSTCSYQFFLKVTAIILSQNIDFSLWITLYVLSLIIIYVGKENAWTILNLICRLFLIKFYYHVWLLLKFHSVPPHMVFTVISPWVQNMTSKFSLHPYV